MMTKTQNIPKLSLPERLRQLAEKRFHVLSLNPEAAMDEIIGDKDAQALVHSFPETDLYLLVRNIGLSDALPLLSLASNKQWEFMVDMDCWKKDRIENRSLSRWLNLLITADPNRFINWFLHEQLELIERYLFHNIELYVREHDQDPSDFPDDVITLDQVYYFKIRPIVDAMADDITDSSIDEREQFLTTFIDRLARYDHATFLNVMMESRGVLSAEIEEEIYRLRNVRLAEKGFLPFDEAIGLYQPIRSSQLTPRSVSRQKPGSGFEAGPLPQYAQRVLMEENRLMPAATLLRDDPLFVDVILELTALANQMAIADQKEIASQTDLDAIVKKIRGYLCIGIEVLSDGDMTPASVAATVRIYMIHDIFRVGYGQVLELKWRAEKWVHKSWFFNQGMSLAFWTEAGMGILGGLLLKRPLYCDPNQIGISYREFESLSDMRQIKIDLEEIIQLDQLLSQLAAHIPRKVFHQKSGRTLTFQNLILTLWARFSIGLAADAIEIDMISFKQFFNSVWQDSKPKVSHSVKTQFLKWLSSQCGMPQATITQSAGRALDRMFDEIESELGSVPETNLDFRFIHLFNLVDHT
ncbi:MAG: DUF6178 family protein [Desulfatirhabdiaceae bacterium]